MAFNVYKSSAGSGKTFTLVKEYIKLSIQNPEDFRHILAVTFTNKAATEMKERVISYLSELSSSTPDTESTATKFLLPEIVKATNLNAAEISVNAGLVLNSILHNYSDFAIGTIDSFVHRIIRTFAHDLRIPLNFEIEMDTDALLAEAIDLLLNKAGSDDQLTKVLVEFTEDKTDDEKSWHIEKDLQIFAQQLFKEDNLSFIENIRIISLPEFLAIRNKLGKLISEFENSIINIAAQAAELIRSRGIPTDAFYQASKGVSKYFETLADGRMDKIKPNTYVVATFEEGKWVSKKATESDKSAIEEIQAQLGEYYLSIQKIKEQHFKHYSLYKLIYSNIYPVAVLSEIEKIIDEMKKENNILPISEFNKRISKIVVSQPVPFIYERLGEKYSNYLIDEFQDTSTLQWTNLLPLIENALSTGGFNMIVGDGKQAIYRWRGGDVQQFTMLPALPKEISDEFSKERIENISAYYKEFFLASNFRSKAEIVDFNNRFFSHISSISSNFVKSVYKDCSQEFNIKNTGGSIQIDFLQASDPDVETYDDVTLKKIKEIISEIKDRNFSLRDIAILCRSNNNASSIARFLIENKIDVISDESLLISASTEVNFILALASLLSNTNDDIAKYRILFYLVKTQRIFDNDIYTVIKSLRKKNKQKDNSINTEEFLAYLQKNNFPLDINLLAALPVYELFSTFISIFSINKITDPYILFFLDAVHEFSSKKNDNISAFLDWWEDQKNKKSVVIPDGINAIRIMTIHKSKGLEFPVVIYPFANDKSRNTKSSLWINPEIKEIPELKSALVSNSIALESTDFLELYQSEKDKSMLDMLNVLYVALTRPSERLYILTKPPSADFSNPASVPDLLASFLVSENKWEENNFHYSFGETEFNFVKNNDKKDVQTQTLKAFPVKKREQVIHLRKKSSEMWDAEDPIRNSEWGNLVHYAMSLIEYADTAEGIINQLLNEGMIQQSREKEFREKIISILNNPQITAFFTREFKIKTEAEILLKDGSIVRPDRIILKDNSAVVIDYKTGGIKDSHKQQVIKYADMLEEMGYSVSDKILVYVDMNKVVLV